MSELPTPSLDKPEKPVPPQAPEPLVAPVYVHRSSRILPTAILAVCAALLYSSLQGQQETNQTLGNLQAYLENGQLGQNTSNDILNDIAGNTSFSGSDRELPTQKLKLGDTTKLPKAGLFDTSSPLPIVTTVFNDGVAETSIYTVEQVGRKHKKEYVYRYSQDILTFCIGKQVVSVTNKYRMGESSSIAMPTGTNYCDNGSIGPEDFQVQARIGSGATPPTPATSK